MRYAASAVAILYSYILYIYLYDQTRAHVILISNASSAHFAGASDFVVDAIAYGVLVNTSVSLVTHHYYTILAPYIVNSPEKWSTHLRAAVRLSLQAWSDLLC